MGYRNAMEKFIKGIPVLMILILGFAMRCELFHTTLVDAVYASYPASFCEVEENEFDSFLNMLKQDVENSDTSCFFTVWEHDSRLERKLKIYTDDEAVITKLKKQSGISNRKYESLLNGATEICVCPLKDYSYEDFLQNPYLVMMGTTDDIVSCYDILRSDFNVSYPQIMQSDEADMIVITWSMIAIFMVLMNGSSILRKKKEIQIRAIYGEDVVGITVRSILEDLILFHVIYVVAKLFVFHYLSGDYKPELSFVIFEIGCLIAAALNLLYLKSDVKAVFSNVTDNKGVLNFLYVLKAVAFAMVIFTLSTNFSSLKKVAFSRGTDELYTQYQDGFFLSITDEKGYGGMERSVIEKTIWEKLYGEYGDIACPVISIQISDAGEPILLLNEFAESLLPKEMDLTNDEAEVLIFHPRNYHLSSEDIEGLLGLYLEDSGKVEWKRVVYDTNISIPYVASNQMTGFSQASNPVVIYCRKTVALNISLFENDRNVIYDMTEEDLSLLDQKIGIKEAGFRLIPTNMGEMYQYQMNFVMRLVRFLSSLCILVILLDFAITVTLCNMEYRIAGMEYAIKKVFGYSIWEKNKRQLVKSNTENLIILISIATIGSVTGIYTPLLCIGMGVLVTTIENIIIIFSIIKMEKISVRKILKGGCL